MKKIESAQSLTGQLEARGEYDFHAALIPPHLEDRDALRASYDDRSLHVPCGCGSIWFHVYERHGGAFVATAVFAADEDSVRCDTVDVMPDHRRKRIATALYQWASALFEAPVVPSMVLSEEAKLFWGDKDKIEFA